MAITRFALGNLDAAGRDALESIPGVKLNGVTAAIPMNCAWMALELGLHEVVEKSVTAGRTAKAALPWLQPWIPEFLTSYQREGVACALASPGESHLFVWSAGSGKTLGALVWSLAAGIGLTVVCTKSGIRPTWAREIESYTAGVEARTLTGEKPEPIELPDDRPTILVIGYDTLPAWVNVLVKLRPVSVVFDEIHLLKSHKRWDAEVGDDPTKIRFSLKDNRSAAAYRLARVARRRLGTTATPVTDRVRDLWAELDLIHPGEWGPYWKWAKRYAGATENRFGGMDDRGKSHLDELKRRIELVRHRVSYSVANRSLPPKRRLVTYVSITEQSRAEGRMGMEIKRAARHGPTALLEARIMEAASRKRGVVLAHARDALEAGQKVTVFTGRRVDCERLKKEAQGWGLEGKQGIAGLSLFSGHGGDSPEVREGIRSAYMESPGPALLVATGDSMGEGMDLQDTDLAILAMLPYTPGRLIQYEGRFARLGQKRPVLIRYLIAEGTVDEHVASILLGKLPAVERIIDSDEVAGLGRELIGVSEEELLASLVEKVIGGAG